MLLPVLVNDFIAFLGYGAVRDLIQSDWIHRVVSEQVCASCLFSYICRSISISARDEIITRDASLSLIVSRSSRKENETSHLLL